MAPLEPYNPWDAIWDFQNVSGTPNSAFRTFAVCSRSLTHFRESGHFQTAVSSIHPLGPYSVQSVGAAEAVSLAIGHNPGPVTTPTQDTSKLALISLTSEGWQAINPTWYYFNGRGGFELRILGSRAHHPNH